MSKHTDNGYITTSLTDAREAHEAHGGFLLVVGNTPPKFAVCQEDQALGHWGRTEGQLRDLETLHDSAEV